MLAERSASRRQVTEFMATHPLPHRPDIVVEGFDGPGSYLIIEVRTFDAASPTALTLGTDRHRLAGAIAIAHRPPTLHRRTTTLHVQGGRRRRAPSRALAIATFEATRPAPAKRLYYVVTRPALYLYRRPARIDLSMIHDIMKVARSKQVSQTPAPAMPRHSCQITASHKRPCTHAVSSRAGAVRLWDFRGGNSFLVHQQADACRSPLSWEALSAAGIILSP
mgnify:CR=1 FL=1